MLIRRGACICFFFAHFVERATFLSMDLFRKKAQVSSLDMNMIIELIELQWIGYGVVQLAAPSQLGRVSCQVAGGTLFPSVGQLNVVAELSKRTYFLIYPCDICKMRMELLCIYIIYYTDTVCYGNTFAINNVKMLVVTVSCTRNFDWRRFGSRSTLELKNTQLWTNQVRFSINTGKPP